MRDAPLSWGVNASTKFESTAPLKIWEAKKRKKFSTFLQQLLSLTANIFGTDEDSDKN